MRFAARYLFLVLFVALQVAAWFVGWGAVRILPYAFAVLIVVVLFVLDEWRARRIGVPPTKWEVRARWRWRISTYAAAMLTVLSSSRVLRHLVGRGTQPDPYPHAMFVLGCVMVCTGAVAYEKEL